MQSLIRKNDEQKISLFKKGNLPIELIRNDHEAEMSHRVAEEVGTRNPNGE